MIPLGLAAVAFALNAAQSNREQRREDRRAAVERSIASDQRREDALRLYLQQVSDLILDRGLLTSRAGSESRAIARTLTLTVLRRVDGRRKGFVVQFLREAGLIDWGNPKISMRGADLRGVTIRGALKRADLSFADLREADFRGSQPGNNRGIFLSRDPDLRYVSFRGADLRGADFSAIAGFGLAFNEANLGRANFDEAQLVRTNFKTADLSHATFSRAQLTNADFFRACLNDTRFARAHVDADLTFARGHNVDFSHAVLDVEGLDRSFLFRIDLTGVFPQGISRRTLRGSRRETCGAG